MNMKKGVCDKDKRNDDRMADYLVLCLLSSALFVDYFQDTLKMRSCFIILFQFDCIALSRWRYSQRYCSYRKMLHADCVFSVVLYHADLKYLLCLHKETLWQLSSLVLYHVIVSPYRGFIQLSIFRIPRHCTTLCTLCIYVYVMNYGWCSVVSIVPQLRMSALSKSQTNTQNVVLTWAEFSRGAQWFMSSLYSVSADIWMCLKASYESRNMLVKGYQPAVRGRQECFSVCYTAEPAAQR